MSNIQTGAERMPHDLSHLGFLAGQIGRLITISTTPVIAGDSFEMDAVGDRKSGSAGMPRPISYAVFCLKKKHLMKPSRISPRPVWFIIYELATLQPLPHLHTAITDNRNSTN